MLISPAKLIPENEIHLTFARSSGAGGQNVNKTATKAILHWSVGSSAAFTDEEKDLIRKNLANRLNNLDELVIMAEEERSQPQNREQAITRLQTLVNNALIIPKKRRATRPTYSSQLKRLDIKKQRSEIKTARKIVTD